MHTPFGQDIVQARAQEGSPVPEMKDLTFERKITPEGIIRSRNGSPDLSDGAQGLESHEKRGSPGGKRRRASANGCVLASEFMDSDFESEREKDPDDNADYGGAQGVTVRPSVSDSLDGCRKALDGLVASANMVMVVIMLSLSSAMFLIVVLAVAVNPAAICARLPSTAS